MTLQQEVKDEVLRQLHDGHWHTTDEVWKGALKELIMNPAYWEKSMELFRVETYAAVQQALIGLALEERIEATKEGRIRIKPER